MWDWKLFKIDKTEYYKMKKVLLIGIRGTYNYGCEAIVRGTYAILKKYDPNLEISYASYNYDDDLRRLKDCGIKIENRYRSKWRLSNIVRKVLSYIGINYELAYDSLAWVLKEKYDTIFSIGGDIYTLGPQGTMSYSLPKFCRKCQKKGIRYVLWGASIGPFEKNPRALSFYKRHLKDINLIVAREKHTIKYLESLNIKDNVCIAPDPAFFVPFDNLKMEQENIIGINLSPLSSRYCYSDTEVAIKSQVETICTILTKTSNRIYLFPHVLADSCNDNDLLYLKRIQDTIPKELANRVVLIQDDLGFVGIKMYLAQCKILFTARMHCAINAISVGVPVIFLSYSEKTMGISKFVYGNSEMVINLKDFENGDNMVNLIDNWDYQSSLESIKRFDFNTILGAI